jgi:Transcriptional regulator, AbiEi antitoxin
MLAAQPTTQHSQAVALLQRRGMARTAEFNAAGITAATVSRMERIGDNLRITRGLYPLPDAPSMPSSRWQKWPDWRP